MKFAFFTLLTTTTILIELGIASSDFKCGVPQRQATVETILHGGESARGKWPWHIALFHRNRADLSYKCGGTLISRVHVLTAAHCIFHQVTGYQQNVRNLVVDAGAHDLSQLQHRQRHSVKAIHRFDNFTRESHRYDIAVLELDSEVEFNQYVQPACVLLEKDLTDMVGSVVGWGRTEFDATSSILREAELPVIDLLTCLNSDRDVFGQTLDRGMLCAGYTNGTGLCNGDSGGGLFIEINGAWYLGGIASFTKARHEDETLCQTKGYSVFTKVYEYLPWIRNTTNLRHLIGEEEEGESKSKSPGKCPSRDASATTNKGIGKLPRQCGVYYPNRVKFGQRTNVYDFPWMAMLITSDGEWRGTGTLIHNRYVLTVAHALSASTRVAKVRLGEHNRDQTIDCKLDDDEEDCAPPIRDIAIECYIRHPDYSIRNSSNDIALFKLARHVEFDDHIQPICLPTVPRLRAMQPTRYIFTGWGRTEDDGPLSPVLLKATIPAVALAECQAWINLVQARSVTLTENHHLCAGGEGLADSCVGDSGGPLGYAVKFRGIRFVQFGIASFGSLSCGQFPTVYTNVSSYMQWIMANID